MAGDGGDRDRGGDADEDQQRRHQKSAADAEHAGHETNRRAHRQDEENIDRNVGDRKVQLHARLLMKFSLEAGRNRSRHGFRVEHSAAVDSDGAEKRLSGNAEQLPRPCITEIVHRRD